MIEIKRTPEFDRWFNGLKDVTTKMRLVTRLKKVSRGNLGDVQSVGEGVSEMREHFGKGWRMYFVQRGSVLVVMLGGGDKSTQARDIVKAIAMSKTLED
ncbi:type II toxin-antitoxin system RelE/ParE family toxin [Denitrificimonas halotolerans]|jgi:putative addiction module killer protein|uniref:Type II toxin-antitoxin system RelE/ParE family toxin n=1 Tax=Denitrificimonas halotolerans TaxID=3098930 RepID=A0ABU5GSA1_9GAMM|nr:type II toxin-antitoxin system RelE/ParE family toxin [Denitrificimonas sp. JX-1]AKX51347.1 addiction module killer protein [Thiopseudomonas alkaliphila]MDY7218518.1 type II toxin-antitoxin system RelE/ParE family toxin [Denitrificimonas sp. JX-1]